MPEVIDSLRVGDDHLGDWLDDGEFGELATLVREGGLPGSPF